MSKVTQSSARVKRNKQHSPVETVVNYYQFDEPYVLVNFNQIANRLSLSVGCRSIPQSFPVFAPVKAEVLKQFESMFGKKLTSGRVRVKDGVCLHVVDKKVLSQPIQSIEECWDLMGSPLIVLDNVPSIVINLLPYDDSDMSIVYPKFYKIAYLFREGFKNKG